MAGESSRDRSVERLLRQALSDPSSAPTPGCVDAERLAAWADGSLRTTERAMVERHLADCAHCQAVLAVFVESEPVAAVAAPFWTRWNVAWLLPAAAAAALLVWVVVPRSGDPAGPSSTSTMARAEPVDVSPVPPPSLGAVREAPMPAAPDAAAFAAPPPAAPPRPAPASAARATAAPAPSPAGARPPAAAPAPPSPAAGAVAAPASPPAAAGAAAVADSSAQVTQTAQERALAPQIRVQSGERSFGAGAQGAARAGAGQNDVMMDGISGLDVGVHARRDASRRVEFGAPGERATSAIAGRTASPPARWRIDPDGRLARSADAGASWTPVALDPSLFITAGSAPSSGVCWVVDRGGAVLLSIDGGGFERTAFVPAVPLVSVQAQSAARAIVVTTDGRSFATTDGGATWQSVAQ